MTNAQLIGKETMLARLIVFHQARFERNGMLFKKDEYTDWLKSLSTRKISKEYDATFAEIVSSAAGADFDATYEAFANTPQHQQVVAENSKIKYSSVLMG